MAESVVSRGIKLRHVLPNIQLPAFDECDEEEVSRFLALISSRLLPAFSFPPSFSHFDIFTDAEYLILFFSSY